MNKRIGAIIFLAGGVVGAILGWEFAKRKFSELAREEIESVKDVYSKRQMAREKPNLSEFTDIVDSEGYSSDKPRDGVVPEREAKKTSPYVISPDDFGEKDEYDTISLTLYADGVLADDNDEVVDDEIVGKENLDSIGRFEDDSVFVRNDILKADYEILLDNRKFSEVAANSPHKIG